jgi:hypothetical protein
MAYHLRPGTHQGERLTPGVGDRARGKHMKVYRHGQLPGQYVIRGENGRLYTVPDKKHGWNERRPYIGAASELLEITGELARRANVLIAPPAAGDRTK